MLGWLALGIVAVWGIWRMALGHPRPAVRHAVLLRSEAAFLTAAGEAMFPHGGALEPSGVEANIAAYADRYAAAVPRGQRVLMRMLFFLVEHATLFFPAPGLTGFRRFSALGLEQRVAVIEDWHSSRFFLRRLVFTSLRAILTMGYVGHPPVLRSLGLAPRAIASPISEADLLYPRIGARPQSIPWTRADLTARRDTTPLGPEGPLDPSFAERAP